MRILFLYGNCGKQQVDCCIRQLCFIGACSTDTDFRIKMNEKIIIDFLPAILIIRTQQCAFQLSAVAALPFDIGTDVHSKISDFICSNVEITGSLQIICDIDCAVEQHRAGGLNAFQQRVAQ